MTDTTDIAALRKQCTDERMCGACFSGHGACSNLSMPSHLRERLIGMNNEKDLHQFATQLIDQLEAERQRAAELQAEQKQHDAQIEQMEGKIQLLTIGFRLKTKHCEKAEAELAEMKRDQAPVAWSVGGWLTFDKKFAECRSNEGNLLLEPLYRHPIITGIDENHYDPELEPGLYVAEIMTKGGAACINGRFTEQVTALDAVPAEYQIREINASGTKWSPWRKVSADYYEKMKPRYEVMNPGVECIQYRELFTAPKKS